ncbi:MAG: hypothetical protein ACREBU_20095, partial [Nitrososphaera sp.]
SYPPAPVFTDDYTRLDRYGLKSARYRTRKIVYEALEPLAEETNIYHGPWIEFIDVITGDP